MSLHTSPMKWAAALPSRKLVDITPSDDTDLDPYVRAIVATGAGDVVIIPEENDDSETFTFTLDAGEKLEGIVIRRVKSTGTTATGLIGFV